MPPSISQKRRKNLNFSKSIYANSYIRVAGRKLDRHKTLRNQKTFSIKTNEQYTLTRAPLGPRLTRVTRHAHGHNVKVSKEKSSPVKHTLTHGTRAVHRNLYLRVTFLYGGMSLRF